MARTTRCPSCAAEIGAQVAACPLCMRQRSRAEIFASLRGEPPREEAAAARAGFGGTLLMLAGLAVLAGGIYLYYRKGISLKEAAAARVEARSRARVEEVRAEAERLAKAEAARAETAARRSGENSPPRAGAAAARGAAHWTVRGEVYDLLRLSPVSGARLTFTSRDSGGSAAAVTGPDGRYSVALPKLESGGYELSVRHKRYGGYLEDAQPPFRDQGEAKRREALAAFSGSAVLHVPLLPPMEEDSVEHDLVLLPADR